MKPSITLLSLFLFILLTTSPLRSEVDCYHDYVSPVAICDAHTIVSLNNNGTAKVFATDIDDGSYDNCHLVEYKVRRMSPGWCPYGIADDTQFRPYVEFCCEDIGQTIWVVLRVVDAHGNYNECMAEVTVQDNSTPHIICPPNITVSCDFWFSYDALSNPYNRTFGTIAVNGAPRLPIIINDPGNAWDPQPKNWGIDGTSGNGVCGSSGNVWVTVPEVIDYRNACGVGIIKRKFYIEAGNWSDWCYQTITVKDYSHGYFNINWPDDYHADGCTYGPDNVEPEHLPAPYNKPTISGYGGYGSSCSLIGYAHDDLVFTFSEGACYKILREWTVIDWCKYQPNNPWSPGIWKHTQVIKLFNHVPPHFVYACQDIVVDGYEPNCSGRFFYQPHVEDDCTLTENLQWDYKIDLWMDDTYDITKEGTGQPTVDKVIPNGWHRILWNVSDECGNYTTCWQKVHVLDKKAPSPICYYGLSTVVMPIGGMVTIWAKDFNVSSYDNCTPQHKLRYSFSANPGEASRTFTCDDLGTVPIHVWVHDEYGNSDYCTTFIVINDNEEACGSMHLVSGLVSTFDNTPMPNVAASMFKIMPDSTLDEDASHGMSNIHGQFNVGFGTTQYDRMVMLNRTSKPLEGVNTDDFISLQRHLSGVQPITAIHKLYAADLDGSGRIGAKDLDLLRKALLGGWKLSGYEGNLNWVFFGNPCTPTTFEDLANGICHNGVEVDHNGNFPTQITFKGLKMGDVNGDLDFAPGLLPRSSSDMVISVVENKTTGAYDFILTRDEMLYGFQMSFNVNGLHIVSGSLPVDESNLGTDADGITNISWGQENAIQLHKGDVLFSLKGDTWFDLMGAFLQNETALTPEAYVENLENQRITLKAAGDFTASVPFETHLTPNPFTDQATLKIVLPVNQDFVVTVYDIKGQELMQRNLTATANTTDVRIGSDIIRTPGIYYYRVTSAMGELSGKFIRQ
jgi:hypothetical protein